MISATKKFRFALFRHLTTTQEPTSRGEDSNLAKPLKVVGSASTT